jgi:hypothetical protein
VWRAARGIDPQDPRPTGGQQPEAAADLWKQHLDRDVAAPSSRTTPTSINDSHRVRHSITVTTTCSARIKHHGRTLRLRPAASDRSQGHSTLEDGLSGRIGQLTADSGSFESRRLASLRAATRLAYIGIPSAASLCRTSRTVISRESRTFGKIGINHSAPRSPA